MSRLFPPGEDGYALRCEVGLEVTEKPWEPFPEDWQRGLAVVAHPDDLEYGAAAAIARWTDQGKEIAYLLVTRGQAGIDGMAPEEAGPLREAEERAGASLVGVSEVEFLDYADGVIEYGLPLRRDIARAIRRHRPDVILGINPHATWGTDFLNMADHRVVGEATLDAARDAGNRWVFGEILAEGYQPWNGAHMVCFTGSSHATHAVDVTGTIDRGVASLQEHRAYIAGLGGEFNPETFLKEAAASAGSQFGCTYAVTFEVFRV